MSVHGPKHIHGIQQHRLFPDSDVMKLQAFAAATRESKLRARPRPPVLETA